MHPFLQEQYHKNILLKFVEKKKQTNYEQSAGPFISFSNLKTSTGRLSC